MKNKMLTFILKIKVLTLATKSANLFHVLFLNLNNEKIANGASLYFSLSPPQFSVKQYKFIYK